MRLGQIGFSCWELIFAIFRKYPVPSIEKIRFYRVRAIEIHIWWGLFFADRWKKSQKLKPAKVSCRTVYLGIGEQLKIGVPETLFGTKVPKRHNLFRQTPSILLSCLEQREKCMPSCFKAIYDNRANSRSSHCQ